MNFTTIRDNLTTILGAAAAGRYQTVDYQVQGSDASEFLGNNRRVQVFYDSGEFRNSKSSQQGPFQHEASFNVWMTVTAEAKANLTVLNDPLATAAAKAAALLASENAASRANDSMDELFGIVYTVLMDGTNLDIGTTGPPFIVSNRWISSLQKNAIQDFGEFVVLTGTANITCQIVETVTGETGTDAVSPAFDITTDIDGDDVEKTGVTV